MHYYKFNIADYRKDTGHLSTLEHGIYRQLIDWQYLDEKPIPKETQVVIRRLRLGSEDEFKSLENVLSEFFSLSEDGYVQKRIMMEIHGYQSNADKNRTNGKLGGRPKKTQSVILGNPNETQPKGNHKPLTINQEPITNINTTPIGVSDSVFQEFKSLRKAKKAPITERAIDGIRTEAEKAGWTLEQAMTECLVRGWTGFKADWVVKPNVADKVHQTVPSTFERDPTLVALDASIKNAKTNPQMIAMIREKLKGRTI